ncbi:MAG: L,D-transpeptidase family protein [Gammaproteobacteria bacterium]
MPRSQHLLPWRLLTGALFVTCLAAPAGARTFWLPEEGSDVIGFVEETLVGPEDTLLDIARRYNVGYEEIRLANPALDPWLPGIDKPVVIPGRHVLPQAPRVGLVLNLAEMRVYYFPEPSAGERSTVITHPVSIGRVDWKTPLGLTRISKKAHQPSWYPPESIRAEHAANDDPLPKVVPPGPDNPLGEHALRLAIPGYLIHGTNKPFGIGMRVSHGCVRMYPEDIAGLFDIVPVGTKVNIIDQPIKAGWDNGVLYLEAHPAGAVRELNEPLDPTDAVRRIVMATRSSPEMPVDWDQVSRIVYDLSGTPEPISQGAVDAPGDEHRAAVQHRSSNVPVSWQRLSER